MALATVAAAALTLPAGAAAQDLYSQDGAGGKADFVFGVQNWIGLKGSVGHPGGQTFKIRGYQQGTACPAKPENVPSPYWNDINIGSPGPFTYPLALTGVFAAYRDVTFCIYTINGGNASGVPDASISQTVKFRDPVDSFNLAVPGTTEPAVPKATMAGTNETLSQPVATFVEQSNQCPAGLDGKAVNQRLTLTFPVPASRAFSSVLTFTGGAGFWRGCVYARKDGAVKRISQTTFTITPAGGWQLGTKDLKKPGATVKPSSKGKVPLGKASCPAACDISITIKNSGKTVGRGSVERAAKGDAAISVTLNRAGKAAVSSARAQGKPVPVKATIQADFGKKSATKSVNYKLR